MADRQLSLPFLTADMPCSTCKGCGDVYYPTNQSDVIGGKRVVCQTCQGRRTVKVPASEAKVILAAAVGAGP
jgi:DnaJ-class molecular chaperone